MPGQILLWRLGSAAMAEDEQKAQRRRGHWLLMARRRKGATVTDAAIAAGLSKKSGGHVSRWEKGERAISLVQLRRLANFYGVPFDSLATPDLTDEERLEVAIRSASDAERADWAAEQAQDPGDGDAPDGGRRRRSA